MAEHLSSVPNDRRLPSSPKVDDATTAELASLRSTAVSLQEQNNELAKDRDLADRECRRLRKEADLLRRELAESREADPRSQAIREVLDYWVKALGKRSNVKVPAGGKRWNAVRARLNEGFSVDALKKACDGCAARPYVGPKGRQATKGPGANLHDGIELICRDETTVERFIGYAEEAKKGAALESALSNGDRPDVRRSDIPGSSAPSRAPRRWVFPPQPPIDRVLSTLEEHGCRVTAYPGKPDSYSAQCPAHEDAEPSLAIHRKADGMVLVHCFASCPTEDVLAALGLDWRDLWEHADGDTNAADAPFRERERTLAPHLRHAMRQLLEADQRKAA